MKRRNSKKTGVIALIAGLSSVTLVSIGFASWVITGGVETTVQGDIVAEDITDSAFLVKDKNVSYAKHGAIYFGCDKSTYTGTNPAWLTNAEDKCNLTATVTFFVSNLTATNKDSEDKKIVDVKFADTQDAAWNTAVTNGYVVAPELTVSIAAAESDSGNLTGRVVTVTVVFGWGAHFGGTNPYNYYNSNDIAELVPESTKTYGEDAYDSLKDLYNLNSKHFVLEIRTGNKISA